MRSILLSNRLAYLNRLHDEHGLPAEASSTWRAGSEGMSGLFWRGCSWIAKGNSAPGVTWLLAQAFGATPEFWMNLQVAYDLVRNKPDEQVGRLVAVT